MIKPRQFVTALLVVACTSLVGCQARSTPEAVQTAIGAAQAVATALPDAQGLMPSLQLVLAGVSLDIKTSPDNVAKELVTGVTIQGTDTTGTLGQLDQRARQAAAGAALITAAQYYPNAAISLSIADGSGTALVTASKAVGKSPEFQ